MAKRSINDNQYLTQKKSKNNDEVSYAISSPHDIVKPLDDNDVLVALTEKTNKLEQQMIAMYNEYKNMSTILGQLMAENNKLHATVKKYDDEKKFVSPYVYGRGSAEYDSLPNEQSWMSYIN